MSDFGWILVWCGFFLLVFSGILIRQRKRGISRDWRRAWQHTALAVFLRTKGLPRPSFFGLWFALAWGALALGHYYARVGQPILGALFVWAALDYVMVRPSRLRALLAKVSADHYRVCPACMYSLAGHPDVGVCPECGRAFDARDLEREWKRLLLPAGPQA